MVVRLIAKCYGQFRMIINRSLSIEIWINELIKKKKTDIFQIKNHLV